MRMLMVLGLNAVGLAADGDAPGQIPPPGAMANAMKDPAMLDQAMKMMQNPLVMQQMKVMMQDPAVKERMRRMLQRLGAESPIEGADALGNDDAALDALFERMQVRRLRTSPTHGCVHGPHRKTLTSSFSICTAGSGGA